MKCKDIYIYIYMKIKSRDRYNKIGEYLKGLND